MKGRGSYVPPMYIPLNQSDSLNLSDTDADSVTEVDTGTMNDSHSSNPPISQDPAQWSSGICACFDDLQSCCIGAICPCFVFGKNAEFLGSGTLAGSCMTHFILWGLVNSVCCLCSAGTLLALPGATVACYACGYRRALRAKYNLQEAPCGDLTTHLFCHLCALCQEYREIRERSDGSAPSTVIPTVTAPQVQTMELAPQKQ